ncbi:CKLF-like MARVEL transmembrane domain-containing protein 1 [Talpa occidentalis]|uniref:CKLF-like MARVEL transmembrane domain-containing protein 1 n=1 Tax=Talpa occidentalis TaxID=50954 RepID=UPI00189048C3|nr:CKLF-like MARVEL transmembrane domain-containing protein 1 [Talpa occidentalis]
MSTVKPRPSVPSSKAPVPPKPSAPPSKASAPSRASAPRPRTSAPPPKAGPAPPAKATEQQQPVPPSTENKDAMQKRAQERARVPGKFRDSIKHYFFTPTGLLKLLRLGLLIGALVCFITAEAHESYIAITILEICIVLFFILVYMLTLHHLLICLDWSLLDLINSFITAVFLILVAIVAMQELYRRQMYSIGGILCLTAAILCIVDAILVTRNLRRKVKRVLGFRIEGKSTPSAEPDTADKPAELTQATSRASTPAESVPSKASSAPASQASSAGSLPGASRATSLEAASAAASRTSSRAPSRAPSQAPSRAASRGSRARPGQV